MAKVRKDNSEKAEKGTKKQEARKRKEKSYAHLRDANFEQVIKAVREEYGTESIMLLGGAAHCNVSVISTGSIKVDKATGVGGLPRGRVIEIYGPEAGGKTTLGLSVIAAAQRISERTNDGKKAGIVDAECALNQSLIEKVSVNPDETLISQPDYGEQGLEITQMLVESGNFSIVMVDSVAALVPKEELYGEMGDANMGLQARMMGRALRRLTGAVKRSGTMVIFINQLRQKIGTMFGSDETTSGGNALKFFASMRIDIRRTKALEDGDRIIGNRVKVKIVKNKLAPPFESVETDLIFGHGFNKEGELLDAAVEAGIVEKSGSWLAYDDEKIGNGRWACCKVLRDNQDLFGRIKADVDIELSGGNDE